MKERPIKCNTEEVIAILDDRKFQIRKIFQLPKNYKWRKQDGFIVGDDILCPYGKPGDRLWVKEDWRELKCGSIDGYEADITWTHKDSIKHPANDLIIQYSRITLEIVNIRVERLQDISQLDIRAEGCNSNQLKNTYTPKRVANWFRIFWNLNHHINTWKANPWVWVIEFKRVHYQDV